jgi:hypothetical protein
MEIQQSFTVCLTGMCTSKMIAVEWLFL